MLELSTKDRTHTEDVIKCVSHTGSMSDAAAFSPHRLRPSNMRALCSSAGEAGEMLLDFSVPYKIALDCIVTEVAMSTVLYLAWIFIIAFSYRYRFQWCFRSALYQMYRLAYLMNLLDCMAWGNGLSKRACLSSQGKSTPGEKLIATFSPPSIAACEFWFTDLKCSENSTYKEVLETLFVVKWGVGLVDPLDSPGLVGMALLTLVDTLPTLQGPPRAALC